MQSRFVVFIVKEKKGESLTEICIFCVRSVQFFPGIADGKRNIVGTLNKCIKYTRYIKVHVSNPASLLAFNNPDVLNVLFLYIISIKKV